MPEFNSIESCEYPCSFLQPHKHMFCFGEAAAENFCSNSFVAKPGCYESKPWCYTTDPKVKWEECNIPMCEKPDDSGN